MIALESRGGVYIFYPLGSFAARKVTPFHIFHEPGTDPEHVENRLSPSLYLGMLVYNFHHHRDELYQE